MHSTERGIYIALLSGGIILLALALLFVITIIRYQKKKVAFHRQKIKGEFSYLDKERERIALDLHDDFGSSLSYIKLRLQCMNDLDEENTVIVDKAELAIDELMRKLRKFSFNLMPGLLQREGLHEALKELLDIIAHSAPFTVSYQCTIELPGAETAVHMYRIAQEILTNIIKHSGASHIDFMITESKTHIQMKVKDNGSGFDKDDSSIQNKGLGLHSIMARVDILKGTLYLETGKDTGTTYLILIPKPC